MEFVEEFGKGVGVLEEAVEGGGHGDGGCVAAGEPVVGRM